MKDERIRLNPFVYVSETDIRFYLFVLIGILMPTFWALIIGIAISAVLLELEITIFLRLLILVSIVLFIPSLIYVKYRRHPKRIIKLENLKEFDKRKNDKQWDCIEKLCSKYLPIKMQPRLMYNWKGVGFATTFGTGNQLYIAVFGKLVTRFNKDLDGFTSILLHEIGHLVNKDVKNVYLAESTWQSLKLTMPIIVGIFLLITIPNPLSMYSFYFLFFMIILYVLRKQIIRLREFYADAKVLEWEQSPDKIVKALQEDIGTANTPLNITNNAKIKKLDLLKFYDKKLFDKAKFYSLAKLHPRIEERINVLKNNLILFTPSLWVAFAVGFFYSIIEIYPLLIKDIIFSISSKEWAAMLSTEYQPSFGLGVGFRAFTSLIFFTVLMIAVSSSFHKLALEAIFVDHSGYFSTGTIFNIMKFSLVFSFGWIITFFLDLICYAPFHGTSSLMKDCLNYAETLILYAFYFSIVLIFLHIFSSMLIRRSFSKKEAMINFLTITSFSSILFIVNRFIAVEILHNKPLLLVFSLIFSFIVYAFIRIKDKKLRCPNCNEKIKVLSELKLDCPNCNHSLYPWAVYPF